MAAGRERFDLFRSLFLDGDGGNVVPQAARAFEGHSRGKRPFPAIRA
jgi:hypothetical protein